MQIDTKAIGRRIRYHRKALDLTQARLAELAGLDTVYLGQVERGLKTLSLDALGRVAEALKVAAGSLIDGSAQPKDDALLREVRSIFLQWSPRQRIAVLKALRTLAELEKHRK